MRHEGRLSSDSRGGLLAEDVHVKGYYRSDGTYVQPHMRYTPDSSYNNKLVHVPEREPVHGPAGHTAAPSV